VVVKCDTEMMRDDITASFIMIVVQYMYPNKMPCVNIFKINSFMMICYHIAVGSVDGLMNLVCGKYKLIFFRIQILQCNLQINLHSELYIVK